jgi:hypothetical protein
MPDFNRPEWQPADAASTQAQGHFLEAEGVYDLLIETDPEDPIEGPRPGSANFLLYEDLDAYESGLPALAAHLHYGADASTFTLSVHPAPTFTMAAAWLVSRGADVDDFLHHDRHSAAPADARSAKAAERFLSEHARYELVEHGTEPGETWAMLRDTTAAGAQAPFLLQVEAADAEHGFTLREGSFASPQEVQQWLEQRRTALPPVAGTDITVVYSPQAAAARTRTTIAPTAAPAAAPAEPETSVAATAAGRRAVR